MSNEGMTLEELRAERDAVGAMIRSFREKSNSLMTDYHLDDDVVTERQLAELDSAIELSTARVRLLNGQIAKLEPEARLPVVSLRDADPELERLLIEEDMIEAQARKLRLETQLGELTQRRSQYPEDSVTEVEIEETCSSIDVVTAKIAQLEQDLAEINEKCRIQRESMHH